MDFVLGRNLLHRLVTTQRLKGNRGLKLVQKLRLIVISVSRRQCWIHLSTLSEFAGPLQPLVGPESFAYPRSEFEAKVMRTA